MLMYMTISNVENEHFCPAMTLLIYICQVVFFLLGMWYAECVRGLRCYFRAFRFFLLY